MRDAHSETTLSDKKLHNSLQLVTKDGLAAEIMITCTSGTFLVAFAVVLGASNFQLGLLAALPTMTNIFQLLSIWMVTHFRSRKAVTVVCTIIARIPLILIALLPFVLPRTAGIQLLIGLLAVHYLFGSFVGPSWNSWMKDLVPEKMLGKYFAHRNRVMQALNVVLSIALSFGIEHIKKVNPLAEIPVYRILFIIGGIAGLLGAIALMRTHEPPAQYVKRNILKQAMEALKNKNFVRFVRFNALWVFANNLAMPFLSVYMLKTMHLPLPYIIGLTMLMQFSSLLFVKLWGRLSDVFSNKTIMHVCAPLFILSLFGWIFVGLTHTQAITVLLLAMLHMLMGASSSGTALAVSNINLKLVPKENAIVYIAVGNIIASAFSAMASVLAGWAADFFTTRELLWNIQFSSGGATHTFVLLHLQKWNYLFAAGGLLCIAALSLLKKVNENNEQPKTALIAQLKTDCKDYITTPQKWRIYPPVQYLYKTALFKKKWRRP